MSISDCPCGGYISLGPEASNRCDKCGKGFFTDPPDTHETQALREQVRVLRAALEELVTLKNLKDESERLNIPNCCDYAERKPKAWEAARKALAGVADGGGGLNLGPSIDPLDHDSGGYRQ